MLCNVTRRYYDVCLVVHIKTPGSARCLLYASGIDKSRGHLKQVREMSECTRYTSKQAQEQGHVEGHSVLVPESKSRIIVMFFTKSRSTFMTPSQVMAARSSCRTKADIRSDSTPSSTGVQQPQHVRRPHSQSSQHSSCGGHAHG
jgi:hypothetical protein